MKPYFYQDHCDRYDYLAAAACGAMAGLVDIFLGSSPADSALSGWTDEQVDHAVMKFADYCGWSPRLGKEDSVASAIGFLEKKYPVNYDQAYATGSDAIFDMSTKNHHLKSLGHAPDIVGLFFSILNQFTETSTFISDGQLITIKSDPIEMQGGDLISKLFCGVANWFGHIMSDVAGSSGTSGRGSGLAIPFYELFGLCDFGTFQVGQYRNTLAKVATKVFQEGYDFRFGLTMAIPVVLCDLSIRLIWALRQHFYYHFDNVYDAVRWIFEEEAVALLREHEGVMLWQDGLLQLFQLAVYRGQPHGISAQPQLFGQSRCADGLFAALLQTLQHGLLLFGTI